MAPPRMRDFDVQEVAVSPLQIRDFEMQERDVATPTPDLEVQKIRVWHRRKSELEAIAYLFSCVTREPRVDGSGALSAEAGCILFLSSSVKIRDRFSSQRYRDVRSSRDAAESPAGDAMRGGRARCWRGIGGTRPPRATEPLILRPPRPLLSGHEAS